MRTFDANGKRYVEINGKTFFLVRFFNAPNKSFAPVFLQVFGTAPLTKDDLPDKAWELIATRGPEGRIFTAWKPSSFKPDAKERLFVGATTAGSVRLLLGALYSDFPADVREAFVARETDFHKNGVRMMTDGGTARVPAANPAHPYSIRRALEEIAKAELLEAAA